MEKVHHDNKAFQCDLKQQQRKVILFFFSSPVPKAPGELIV